MRRTPLRSTSRRVWTADENGSRRPQVNGGTWRLVRERVAARGQGRCQGQIPDVCEGRGAHAHHIQLRAQGGADSDENVAWLCHACHGHVHAHPAWAMLVGLIRSRHQRTPVWDPTDGEPCPLREVA